MLLYLIALVERATKQFVVSKICFKISINILCFLGVPHLMPPQAPPTVSPFFMSLTCGDKVIRESLVGLGSITMSCIVHNGTDPLVKQVYKDGELISGAGFPYVIVSPTDDDFGTYTFNVSTEKCGCAYAVSRLLQEG